MAVKPMPVPSADTYLTADKQKKKKQTNSGYATNTVTSSPQPAQDVSIPSATKNYEQPVPQPPKVTSQTVKSSGTAQTAVGAKNAVDTIQSRPYIYDSVPIPQTNMSGYKQPQGYSSTKSTQKQTGGYTESKAKTTNSSVYGHSAPENNYGPNREAAQSVQLAEYKPKQEIKTGYSFGTANPQYTSGTAYSPQNPYTTKDRVTGYSIPKLPQIKNSTDNWGVPKTIKDGAQPKVEWTNLFDNSRQNYGIHHDIAQNTFLDHRGQNPIEKIVEKNTFDLSDYNTVATKDNIYTKPKETIEKELNKTGTFVNREISALKRQREDLLFDLQYGRIDSDDEQLKKVNYDIQYLEHIEKKIELGLKYSYQFEQEDLNRLSNMSIDDILNSKEEFSQNLPYLSPYAQAIRSANKGYKSYQNSVGVVDNIGVEYIGKDDKFRIFDKNHPENEFKFRIDSEFNPKGYYESKIFVEKTNKIPKENVYYDLAESLDGMVVSDKVKEQLKFFAEPNIKLKSEINGVGITDIASYTFDIVDLMIIVGSDYKEDGEFGLDTSREVFGTVGSWAGDIAGGIAGAKIGASLGMAGGPPGVVIGSVLGAAFGAYLLSSATEDLGRYLGEHMYDSEYSIEQYYERGK